VLCDLALRSLLSLCGLGAIDGCQKGATGRGRKGEVHSAHVVGGLCDTLGCDQAVDMLGDLHGREVLEVHGVQPETLEEVGNLSINGGVAEDTLLDDKLEDRAHELVCRLLPGNHELA